MHALLPPSLQDSVQLEDGGLAGTQVPPAQAYAMGTLTLSQSEASL